MATLTIRNVPAAQADQLKVRAASAGTSVEQLLRDVIAQMTKPVLTFGRHPEWRAVDDDVLLAPLGADELAEWSA